MDTTHTERHRFDDATPFKVDGVYCKLIPLSKGQYATVWESDYKWLMQWNWCARWNDNPETFYAVRGTSSGSKFKLIYMHRIIVGLSLGDARQCDHKTPKNALDCRRSNLRVATRAQNHWNQGLCKRNKSGYKGVHFRKDTGKWTSQITVNGKTMTLGSFVTKESAYKAYCQAAEFYHGKFARVK